MQLLLLAVDPDRDGRTHFTAALAPALVLADLLDKTRRGRPAPDSMSDYLRVRAPSRLDRYIDAAKHEGILDVSVRRDGYFGHTRIRIADRWPLERAVDRLLRILDTPQHPHDRDLAYVILAHEIGRAHPHLKGRKHRDHRRRLDTLTTWPADHARRPSTPNAVLYAGLHAMRLTAGEQQQAAPLAALR
ncbi:hypothetical protein Caci_5287 [Catenulispora acidiphila DSM 44928]|uniref:GPP34 family phosphoprotein n=1 Tax=Catenulispora acidiphila (strain DSM 44928 / JCM 14897 / NBRC 102108 / NRRL B-24433 / ID139908) TaxID=479433 RepID=C7Q7X9_CATAD|nr:GPP34 family phosphoprotein [Catenulispora acidiphila]ACU74146.1 hypothetical protein Caci_5287 [Catenulispora acidiphila DSM 44928]